MERQNVRVDTKILNKVRKHIKKTKQSIGGFYDLAAKEKLEIESALKVDVGKTVQLPTDYLSYQKLGILNSDGTITDILPPTQ